MKLIFKTYLLFILSYGISNPSMLAQNVVDLQNLTALKIKNEDKINSANLESSPAFYGDKIAFVYSGIKQNIFDKDIDEAYFNLSVANVNFDNSLLDRVDLNSKINSDFHEGPMTFDSESNTMLFTRSHKAPKRLKGATQDTFYLRIMSADMGQAKPNVLPIALNVDRYSVCHPTLSRDGKTMIFSSNKIGGNGKMDLYIAYFDGVEWTGVLPLNKSVNSAQNEVFPFILNDTLLIFSSDRIPSQSGFDLFVSKLENGDWTSPERLPSPFNSAYDDLGMIVRNDGRSGYFSSNRLGGKGKDDIYSFENEYNIFGRKKIEIKSSKLTVLDKLTLLPLVDADVTVTPLAIDVNNFTISSFNVDMLSGQDQGDLILKLSPKKDVSLPILKTDSIGNINFDVIRGKKYLIQVIKKEYAESSIIYDLNILGQQFNMVLEPDDAQETMDEDDKPIISIPSTSIVIPTTEGEKIIFENIYYDYNSSAIKTGATSELDALASTMEENPDMQILLESHTDSRGEDIYNLNLSKERAISARNYLQSIGVDEDRIAIRGFGERKLRNECKDNIPCTEEKHRFNRRTEVIILKN